jgi:succinyl-diaminopimelate desuccinylase
MQTKDLFEKLLRYKSITPDDAGAFEFIKTYLSDFEIIEINKEDVKNLFLYKKYGNGKHLCFAGHIDVVPAGDGWDSDPFEPKIVHDTIYARGTQDMKSGLAAFINAVKSTQNFNGTISLLLTSDEEGDAKYGTIEVIKHLEKINFLPNFVVVAEPTCENVFGDAIKVGRRGSINGVVKIHGKQGHAAYPEKSLNPINQIAPILPKIAGVNLDEGDEYFSASKFVITDIRAGMEVTNVTPNELKMMFNVRNSTKTTKEDIEKFLIDNLEGLNYSINISVSAKPFVTNKESIVVKAMQKAIKDVLNIDTKLSTAGGTSDARFFGEYKIPTIEFGVINDTIHSVNENTKISYVKNLEKVFVEVINNISKS